MFESWRAWEHLSHADFLQVEYTGVYDTSCTFGTRCLVPGTTNPEAELGDNTGLVLFETTSALTWAPVVNTHVYIIGSPNNNAVPAWEGLWTGRGLTSGEALAIDVKIDDGDALTGGVGMVNGVNYTPTCTGGDYVAPASYDVSVSGLTCVIMVDAEFDN